MAWMTAGARCCLACIVFLTVVAARAEPVADDPKTACAESYQAGQERRLEGRLLAAKAELIRCMADACPEVARMQCGEWLAQVERDVPTVVLEYVDAAGRSRTDVSVRVDGQPFAAALDGQALPIDPGPHEFVFEPSAGPPVEERLTILAGEKNRRVTALVPRAPPPPSVAAPSPEPPPEESPSVHPSVWALGGVSIVGFALFAGFGLHSISLEGCAPTCSDDEVGDIRTERIVADVGLGVGLAGLAATVLVAVLTYD
jgi:hypothetical protein